MNKVEEILKSWAIQLSPNEKQNHLAAKRLEICNTCENKKKNGIGVYVCNLCGCVLKSKVFTPAETGCPIGKW